MGEDKFIVKFWGVRGGYPMPGPTTVKYGGNTTCVQVRAGRYQIIIDGGTGIIGLGRALMSEHLATGEPMHATVLVTHTHHDHTQGFPFFIPTRHPASILDIFGPNLPNEDMEDFLDGVMRPPVFPLGVEELYSKRRVTTTRHGDTIVLPSPNERAKLYSLGDEIDPVPDGAVVIKVSHGYNHPRHGILFFRIFYKGRSVVMATDTEGYVGVDRKLADFARDAELLIHDSEYDENEYGDDVIIRQGWGHSTWRMAVDVANLANVKRLALTHHNPGHDDAYLEKILAKAQEVFPNSFLAQEGLMVEV
jgi:phosphoribosyl 1,2-cyclic phosphodiesterase